MIKITKKQFVKWANDFPLVEICGLIFIILFLTIAVLNVLMGGKLVEEKFISDVIDNIIKAF